MNIHPIIDISIHAPREGCDYANDEGMAWPSVFQSTHPVRGATGNLHRPKRDAGISIHAPREGCDWETGMSTMDIDIFQSTHPVRGATTNDNQQDTDEKLISIHAPREGCDGSFFAGVGESIKFQSTHPVRGATNTGLLFARRWTDFNPRTP